MSEEERIKRDIQLGKEMHTVACQTCGATVGWVRGNRYRREVESKREALKKVAALEAERDKLRELLRDSLVWLQVAQNVNVTVCESLEIAELRRNIATALNTDSTD